MNTLGKLTHGSQKAWVAGIVTLITSAATSLLTALQALGDGAALSDLDTAMWLTVIIAVLGSTGLVSGGVYAVRNERKPPSSAARPRPEGGLGSLGD